MTVSMSLQALETSNIRNLSPKIVYGKIKPRLSPNGLYKYPEDYQPILEYWEQLRQGVVQAPVKIIKQYREIASWITAGGYKEWYYSPARANHVLEFAENFCKHSKGRLAGQRIVLELWEKAFLASVYGFIDIDGLRKHQKAVLIVGKKNGKSLLESIMGLYGLIGDSEGGPEIYAVATKKDQAKIVWREAKSMVKKSPALRKRIKPLTHELDASEYNDGIFKPLASDIDTLDGLNVHVVLMDEIHQWRNGRSLYDIMADGIGAREQPLIVMASTAGTIREDLYDEIYEEAESQLNAYKLDPDMVDDRSLYMIYELDKKEEWEDPSCWVKANPGIGTIKKLRTLQDKVTRAQANPRFIKNLVCKEFNIRETATEAWLTFEELNNTATFDLKKLKPGYAIGGSDLSSTTDLTCGTIIFMLPDDDTIYCLQKYWLPEDLFEERIREDKVPYDKWLDQGWLAVTPGNKVDKKYVEDWFITLMTEHDIYIPWHGYDSWSAEYYVQSMRNVFGQEAMEAVIQGKKTLSSPMKSLGADLAKKRINYNNNSVLKWCLANTIAERDKNDNIQPHKGVNPRKRIDGAASLLNAYVVLERHYDEYLTLI